MQDVTLLVNTFYEFGEKKRKRIQELEEKRLAEKEEFEMNNSAPQKNEKDAKNEKGKDGKDGKKKNEQVPPEPIPYENEEEEKDPTKPDLDLDDVVECLEEFHHIRAE